jgi:hypothetical protein
MFWIYDLIFIFQGLVSTFFDHVNKANINFRLNFLVGGKFFWRFIYKVDISFYSDIVMMQTQSVYSSFCNAEETRRQPNIHFQ